MTSEMWFQSPAEAFRNPYNYLAQKQFVKEASALLDEVFKYYNQHNLKFTGEDKSALKAQWMLQMDAIDNLRDCIRLIEEKRHRIVARLFRDIVEALDLASYFAADSPESQRDLGNWYNNEIIENSKVRSLIKKQLGNEAAKYKAEYYRNLSTATHSSYRFLLNSYCIGGVNALVYDGYHKSLLILPQTVAQYMAVLSSLIATAIRQSIVSNFVDKESLRKFCLGLFDSNIDKLWQILEP